MGIISGFIKTKRYRKLADNSYQIQSEWTHSDTVEMDDGKTLTDKINSITSSISSHKHSASKITAGTFGGTVVAPASTSYTNNQLRNIVFTDIDPEADSPTNYANGSIICVYE